MQDPVRKTPRRGWLPLIAPLLLAVSAAAPLAAALPSVDAAEVAAAPGATAAPSDAAGAQDAQAQHGQDAQARSILGNWLTAMHDGIIQISQAPDGHLQGRIVGGDTPDRTDQKNPDVSQRQQRLLGLLIMRDLRYDGAGRWSGGTIYDPDSGHTYHCRLQLLGPDRLKVRGFLGVSLLGRAQIWTRYTGASMVLPAR